MILVPALVFAVRAYGIKSSLPRLGAIFLTFGVIAGVILVAYNSAQKGSEELQASNEFNSFERVAWHFQHSQSANSPASIFGGEIFQLSF